MIDDVLVFPKGNVYHDFLRTDAGKLIPACQVRFGGVLIEHSMAKLAGYEPCRNCKRIDEARSAAS